MIGLFAIWHGLVSILTDRTLRRLAIWPLAISTISYFFTLWAAISIHSNVLSWVAPSNSAGFWMAAWYYLAWVLVTAVLLVLTVAVSFFLVCVLSGPFQSRISSEILTRAGVSVPEDSGISGLTKEACRTVVTETLKFICFLPFVILSLITGFIPILLPFTLLLGAWLLAYRFLDVPLDVIRIGVFSRIKFALKHSFLFVKFGAVLMLFWLIPFAGIFLAPAAAAGATWLLIETKLINEVRPKV